MVWGVTLLCARVRDHTSGVCIGVLSGSFSLFPNSVHSLITPLLIKQSQPDLIRRKISKAEMSLSNVVQLGSQMEAKYPWRKGCSVNIRLIRHQRAHRGVHPPGINPLKTELQDCVLLINNNSCYSCNLSSRKAEACYDCTCSLQRRHKSTSSGLRNSTTHSECSERLRL